MKKKTERWIAGFARESFAKAAYDQMDFGDIECAGFPSLAAAKKFVARNWKPDFPQRKFRYWKITVREVK